MCGGEQTGIMGTAEGEQKKWQRTEMGSKRGVKRSGNSALSPTATVNNSVKRSEII